MMLTLRLTDMLLMILTAFACVGVIYAIALMRRMNTMLDDWRKTAAKIDEVLPHVQRLCSTSEEAMRSVKSLTDEGAKVVVDVAEVSSQVREVAEQGIARINGLMGAFDTISMVVGSFKAGLAAVQSMKENAAEEPENTDTPSEETDDAKRNL